jgi:hypothetical protein
LDRKPVTDEKGFEFLRENWRIENDNAERRLWFVLSEEKRRKKMPARSSRTFVLGLKSRARWPKTTTHG